MLLTDAMTEALATLTASEVHSVQRHISEKQVGEKAEQISQNRGRKKQHCTDTSARRNHWTEHHTDNQ